MTTVAFENLKEATERADCNFSYLVHLSILVESGNIVAAKEYIRYCKAITNRAGQEWKE